MLRFLMPLLFFPFLIFAQLDKNLDKKIGISDEMTHKELRIYKKIDIVNYVSLFRFYQNEEQIWKAEYYECHFIHEDDGDDDFRKKEIKFSKEPYYVWLEILNSDVLYLAEQSAFKYKLKGKSKIENINGSYESVVPKILILDGVDYVVKMRDGDKINSFEYDNPEMYLKHYPNVDELSSFMDLKKIIKKRFAIEF